MKFRLEKLDQINTLAHDFLRAAAGKKIFAFYGSMGAGKTTFIKALCKELGAVDIATSPTFTLVNEYLTDKDDFIYHFDFYRIERPEEALDFGFDEYLLSGKYCFIEWPEKIENLLPDGFTRVHISTSNNLERIIELDA